MKKSILILSFLFSFLFQFKTYATFTPVDISVNNPTIGWYYLNKDNLSINYYALTNTGWGFYFHNTWNSCISLVNSNNGFSISDCLTSPDTVKEFYMIYGTNSGGNNIVSGDDLNMYINEFPNYSFTYTNIPNLNSTNGLLPAIQPDDCPTCQICQTCPPVEPPTDLDKINKTLILIPASIIMLAFFSTILKMYMGLRR